MKKETLFQFRKVVKQDGHTSTVMVVTTISYDPHGVRLYARE